MITTGNAKGYDEHGSEILWSSQGQQVMMQWEKQYMQRCADALRIQRSSRVLEVGFGLAYSATHIQSYHPTHHTIIECDAAVIQDAEAFAGMHSGVEVVRGTWQSVLPTLKNEQFDCVFFDDYPLPELEKQGITQNQNRTLRTRSRWHDFLDAVLPHVAVGGRITGYLARDIDLQRKGCRVVTTPVEVRTSDNCSYFPHKTALVPVITVLDPHSATHMHDEDSNSALEPRDAFPSQASSRLRRIVLEKSAAVQSSSTATSHRRIADIREVLQKQEHLEIVETDLPIPKCPVTRPDFNSSSSGASDPSGGDDHGKTRSEKPYYSDAASRKMYLDALRLKKQRAVDAALATAD